MAAATSEHRSAGRARKDEVFMAPMSDGEIDDR
jgi:hypothetical protein